MGHIILGTGNTIRHLGKVLCIMLMAIFIKVSGRMINQMGLGNISIQTVSFMKGSGKTTSKTEGVYKYGRTGNDTKANSTRASNPAGVPFVSTMALTTKASFTTIKFTAKVRISHSLGTYIWF
jgi:hypothetical protein